MEQEEMITSLEERGLTYVFLARSYREELPLNYIEALRDAPPSFEGYMGDFIAGLETADLVRVRTDLAADYAALFLGMSSDPVAPYESVYTSQEALLMQQARDEVLAWYRKEALSKTKEFNLPEDHIALELEFAALLCERAQGALRVDDHKTAEEYLNDLSSFVATHLANWVPSFTADIRKRATTDFYRGLAEVTASFIEMEHHLSAEKVP